VRGFTLLGAIFVLVCAILAFGATRVSGVAGLLAGLLAAGAGGLAGASLLIALAVRFREPLGRLLARVAFPIFMVAVVATVFFAWVPALLYEEVDRLAGSVSTASGEPRQMPLGVAEIRSYLLGSCGVGSAWVATLVASLLWLLQFGLVRDLITVTGIVVFVSLVAMFGIWWERKVAGRIQSRLGPMRVGGWHGWAQSLADGLKLLQKEDIFLSGADRPLFYLAPYVAFVPALSLFSVLPFSAAWVCRDLEIGLIFILALLALGVLGVLLAGWSSNNKWSLLGSMREACQMISYEIPLGFSLLVPVMSVGSLRLTTLGEVQANGFTSWVAFASPFTLAAAVIFFIGTLASCKRAPFDLPEAESELVAGYHTEYSGFRWALFFFAEYAEMFAVGALATILFFGAWYSPLPAAWGAAWERGPIWQRALHGILFSGPLWLIGKSLFFVYLQMWLRWTLPRVRLDQVMFACVQVLLPLALMVLAGNSFWQLWVLPQSGLARLANLVCAVLGALVLVAMLAIIVYARVNRRRLVGSLVVEHLPGA